MFYGLYILNRGNISICIPRGESARACLLIKTWRGTKRDAVQNANRIVDILKKSVWLLEIENEKRFCLLVEHRDRRSKTCTRCKDIKSQEKKMWNPKKSKNWKELKISCRRLRGSIWRSKNNRSYWLDDDPWGRSYRIVMKYLRSVKPSAIEELLPDALERVILTLLEDAYPDGERENGRVESRNSNQCFWIIRSGNLYS